MPRDVRIADGVPDAILAHARAEAPRECCGLLVGLPGRIEQAVPARNAADRPATRFLIDPRDYFSAIHAARATERAVIGFYHSHPAGRPEPSATDLAEADDPEAIHIIAGEGTAGPLTGLRAFNLADGAVICEVTLVAAEPPGDSASE